MRKPTFTLLAAMLITIIAHPQYWQQRVDYTIDVTLNDLDHSLNGFEKITYHNQSPDTLRFIWLHLWPNAYKNDKTAFSEQLLLNHRTDFYFSKKEQRGYINRMDVKVNGITAQIADHPQYIDIIQLLLPSPLAPGQQAIIKTPFHVQLPNNFSRGGHTGQSYQVTQWFPKAAVYDKSGWHPMPYLDQGEFYSNFGNYDVSITLPANYVVAATGELQDEAENEWLKQRSSFSWTPIVTKKTVRKGSYRHVQKEIQQYPHSSSTTKTLHYLQENVVDFAWFADKLFIVQQDTLQLPSGKTVKAYSYYLPDQQWYGKKSVEYIKQAVRYRSNLLGEYPYNTVSIVEASMGVDGGMEYPTITSISPMPDAHALETTVEHEVGHNWLQGILASNERAYPWMDEGMNTYYDYRYTPISPAPADIQKPRFPFSRLPNDPLPLLLQSITAVKKDQPIATAADHFTELNNEVIGYYKTAQWLQQLEQLLGRQVFDSCMKAYYQQWQFKHPGPQDFKNVFSQISGENLDSFFENLHSTGSLPTATKRKLQPVAFFNLTNSQQYRYINIMPAVGYNHYDQFMMGLLLHNYSLPAEKFQYLLAPMYGTGSKQLTYLARAAYTWYPKHHFYSVTGGVAASSFSMDDYQPANADKLVLGFRKIVPFIRLTLKENDPLSKRIRYFQFKPYFIHENGLLFSTVITGPDTTDLVEKTNSSRYLNQLQWVVENNRALYPYRTQLQVEQADGFIRAAFTGNYYFNYANNKSGLRARLFAGKFFYTNRKTNTRQFDTDRYHLNMTGANGYEDYTYSNYFLGRNEFEGTANRQIMLRDGAFKVRTDLLGEKYGKTDDWLIALNFVSDIADKKFPVKVFADIGSYAGAWQKDPLTPRFLFDAGLQLSLLHETVNIYLPLVYSAVFRDYFKSSLGNNYMLKTISFSIDIQQLRLRDIYKTFDF
ncbi:MAG TPA: M1 family metallopeptidase [Chitinophagaceae bacterium]|nr:M1 family metallopeptidase [Chitinophagaceae bacterium]